MNLMTNPRNNIALDVVAERDVRTCPQCIFFDRERFVLVETELGCEASLRGRVHGFFGMIRFYYEHFVDP